MILGCNPRNKQHDKEETRRAWLHTDTNNKQRSELRRRRRSRGGELTAIRFLLYMKDKANERTSQRVRDECIKIYTIRLLLAAIIYSCVCVIIAPSTEFPLPSRRESRAQSSLLAIHYDVVASFPKKGKEKWKYISKYMDGVWNKSMIGSSRFMHPRNVGYKAVDHCVKS